MTGKRAYSLMETLCCMTLFLLVLGFVVDGLRQLNVLGRDFQTKSRVYTRALHLLARLSGDLREANQVTGPPPGATGTDSTLTLKKVAPSAWAGFFPGTPQPQRPASLRRTRKAH